jgi:hypothetical protein
MIGLLWSCRGVISLAGPLIASLSWGDHANCYTRVCLTMTCAIGHMHDVGGVMRGVGDGCVC